MQAYTNIEDPSLIYEKLHQLGSKLQKLHLGRKYEVKTLTQDLAFGVRKATPAGLRHLTLDEPGNHRGATTLRVTIPANRLPKGNIILKNVIE